MSIAAPSLPIISLAASGSPLRKDLHPMHAPLLAARIALPMHRSVAVYAYDTVLAILATLVLSLGCTQAETSAPPMPPGDTTDSAASPQNEDTTSARTATISACTSDQLRIASIFREGAAGSRFITFAFTNEGESVCSLKGYPAISPIDSSGAPVTGIDIVESENTYVPAARAAEDVHLTPGQQASFQIAFGAVETEGETCVDAAGLAVTPPGASDSLHVDEPLYSICTGELRVTPIVSGIPQF